MYALRTADIPPRRHGGSKGGEAGANSTGLGGVDIHFEESKLDLSLHRFTSKPAGPSVQLPSKKATEIIVPARGSTNVQPTVHQRKRLVKKKSAFLKENHCKRACDDISRDLRDPDKHHAHFTEDYPEPRKQREAGSSVAPPRGQLAELANGNIQSEGGSNVKHEEVRSVQARHGTVLDDQDVPSEHRPKSSFQRGLARVKSMSAILINSGRTDRHSPFGAVSDKTPQMKENSANPHDSEKSGTGNGLRGAENAPVPRQVALKHNAEKAKATPPPTVGFLTNEAMQHDRERFANAFRSRIEVQRQRELEKASSAAARMAIRGGWGDRDRGFDVPDWVRDMDDRMRRMREDPEFQPFRRTREHQGDDGSYHYRDEFDVNTGGMGFRGRRGPRDGREGRDGGRDGGREGDRRGGGLGGRIRGLFGGRPRSPPGRQESDSEEDFPREPPRMGRRGMGQPNMGGFDGMPFGIGVPMGMDPRAMGGPMGMGPWGGGAYGGIPVVMGHPGMGYPGVRYPGMAHPDMGGPGVYPGGGYGEEEGERPRDEAQDLDPAEARYRRGLRMADMVNCPEYAAHLTAQRAQQLNRNRGE